MWTGGTGRVIFGVLLAALVAAPIRARQTPTPAADAAGVPADWTNALVASRDRYTPDGRAPVELRFFIKTGEAHQAERIVSITRQALALCDAWFGPYPYSALTIIDAPFHGGPATAAPGVVVTTTRWLTQARDMTLERGLLAAIARQYWRDVVTPEGRWFQEALSQYSGTRVIHEALEGANFATYRFFGGVVPFTIRSLLLSPHATRQRPRLTRFAEVDNLAAGNADDRQRASRGALAMLTLERYLGWPAFQQALLEYRRRSTTGSPVDLATVISEQRGRDVKWFFAEAFRAGARFDYAVTGLTSEPAQGLSGFRTRVTLQRVGDGIFAGSSEPRDPVAGARSLPIAIRFEDGTEVSEWWDGRDAAADFTYDSRSRAEWASVDPNAVLFIDDNRGNNTLRLSRPFVPIGARLALNWILWLQDAALSYTCVL